MRQLIRSCYPEAGMIRLTPYLTNPLQTHRGLSHSLNTVGSSGLRCGGERKRERPGIRPEHFLPFANGRHFKECASGRQVDTFRVFFFASQVQLQCWKWSSSSLQSGPMRALSTRGTLWYIISEWFTCHTWDTVKHCSPCEYTFSEAFKINYSSCLLFRFSVQGAVGTNNHFLVWLRDIC